MFGLHLQALEKEQRERIPRADELNQTGQILVEQMGKGKILDFFPHIFQMVASNNITVCPIKYFALILESSFG